jgi:hypothetical protein
MVRFLPEPARSPTKIMLRRSRTHCVWYAGQHPPLLFLPSPSRAASHPTT